MIFLFFKISKQKINTMGQKAKNAGKKNSKTCNKLATTKSVNCSGGRMKLKCIESHFAIHTFPEENKTYIELSSCNEEKQIYFVNNI